MLGFAFYVRLQKSAAETVWMMKEACKYQILGTSAIFRWYEEFSEG